MPIANKLYPPTLGKIPAFYGNILTVPFTMNRSVHKKEVTGFAIIVKNILSDTLLINALPAYDWDLEDKMEAYFDVSSVNMVPGEYYKVQLAYMSSAGIGYYSSVATVKCTSKPDMSIVGLERYTINLHMFNYMGQYSQKGMDKDTTEKVYNYRFDVWDSKEQLVATSGDLIHSGIDDTEYHTSLDSFEFPRDLELNEIYYIQYTVKTNNGLICSSPRYRLIQHHSVDPEMDAELFATNNFDNGYITLKLQGATGESGLEIPATGFFAISRSSSNDNFMVWNEIARFSMQAQPPSQWEWKDFTTEQGVTYKYSVQQYNDAGLYSNRIISNEIRADFEDAFLYDGERQLKVKYNPKVSTFKVDVQEIKQDTIGNQYPYIFRNGNIYYKEFSLSSMLSYYSDEEELFITKDELKFEGHTINLVTGNLYSERVFKLKAYEWLTNGKPKVFRSPGEGNYIVRLINTTMTPNDPTGRMLHTFNCTAYEIAEYNYNNLEKYEFITVEEESIKQMRWETIELWKMDPSETNIKLNKHPAAMLEFIGMTPGEKVIIDDTIITIGSTGGYLLNNIRDEVINIELPAYGRGSGQLTYGYYATKENLFDTITDFEVTDIADRQFIGAHDIINSIADARTTIERWHLYSFYKRPTMQAYYKDLNQSPYTLYYDSMCKDKIQDLSMVDPWLIYELYDANPKENTIVYLKTGAVATSGLPIEFNLTGLENPWKIQRISVSSKGTVYSLVDPKDEKFILPDVLETEIEKMEEQQTYYYDYFNDKLIPISDYETKVYIDGVPFELNEIQAYKLRSPDVPKTLVQSDGVVGHVSLRIRTTEYRLEEKNDYIKDAKQAWMDALSTLKYYLFGYPYNLELISRHWLDDFKPQYEHWSGTGIGCNENARAEQDYKDRLSEIKNLLNKYQYQEDHIAALELIITMLEKLIDLDFISPNYQATAYEIYNTYYPLITSYNVEFEELFIDGLSGIEGLMGWVKKTIDKSIYNPNLGYMAALIWTNIDEGLNSAWLGLGADITYREVPYEMPTLLPEDYYWMTCCSVLKGSEIPDAYLSGYVLAGAEWTLFETLHDFAPAGWDKVWVDLTPYEVTGTKPYDGDSRWMQAYTNLEGLVLGMYMGDTPIGIWWVYPTTEAELEAKVPITKTVDGELITDYETVIAEQRKEVIELYSNYINLLKQALIEDEEARKQ